MMDYFVCGRMAIQRSTAPVLSILNRRGKTWSDKDVMLSGLSGCPQEQYFFKDDGLLILMTTIKDKFTSSLGMENSGAKPQPQQSLLGSKTQRH